MIFSRRRVVQVYFPVFERGGQRCRQARCTSAAIARPAVPRTSHSARCRRHPSRSRWRKSRKLLLGTAFLGQNEAVVDPVKDGLAKRPVRHPIGKGAQCSAERVTQAGGHGYRLPALTRRVIRNCRVVNQTPGRPVLAAAGRLKRTTSTCQPLPRRAGARGNVAS